MTKRVSAKEPAFAIGLGTPDSAVLSELLHPYPAKGLEVYPVSASVNRASSDGPELIEAQRVAGLRQKDRVLDSVVADER